MNKVMLYVISLILPFSGLLLAGETQTSNKMKQATMTTLNVLTVDLGTIISAPLIQRGLEFEVQTGVNVSVTKVPFGALYGEINKDFISRTGNYDVIVYPSQWMVDFAQNGYIEDLTGFVGVDTAIQWNDISRFFRDFSSKYAGRIYSIPLDGDIQLVYYRLDIFSKNKPPPPRTWDEYLEIAEKLQGVDMNDDGIPDYGSCISKKPNEQSYWPLMSIASSYLQSMGTSQGIFFDTNNMTPLINNEAFAEALRVYVKTTDFGPPGELDMDTNDVRYAFIHGQCAMAIDWGDIGTMAYQPGSKVKDKTGVVMLPGSKRVLNRKTGRLAECNESLCPYAIGGINSAPYAAFGGWVGSVNSFVSAQKKELAYKYLSYVSQPAQSNIDVAIGGSGMNPYRTSQLKNNINWKRNGMSKQAMHYYLGAITKTVNNANIVLDLRVFENNKYFSVVLDDEIARVLRGERTIHDAMNNIEMRWNKITDEVGRQKQLDAYRASLGRKLNR
jgi:multiple sugar transport system substrate-binding protein